MKVIYALTFLTSVALSIFASEGDTFNCAGGYWVVRDEVAKCVAGGGTVPNSTIPLPTPAYTPSPLLPSCKPIDKQTPTPESTLTPYAVNLPIVAKGN